MKQTIGQAQVALTLNDSGRQNLQQQLWAQQSAEIAAAAQAGRAVQVSFDGQLQQVTGSTWQVSGLAIQVTPQAVVVGSPNVGSNVRIHAVLPGNGTILARSVETLKRSRTSSTSPLPTPRPTGTREPDEKNGKDKGDDHSKDKKDDGNKDKDKGGDHGKDQKDNGNHDDQHVTPAPQPDPKTPHVERTPQPDQGDNHTPAPGAGQHNNGNKPTTHADPAKHGRDH